MHTPAPWIAHEADDLGFVVRRMIGQIPSVTVAELRYGQPQAEANARLIAAAPDLLAALKWALTVIRPGSDLHTDMAAAIAKATDESSTFCKAVSNKC